MVKGICLDKATDADGNPAPVTFQVKKVLNGRETWHQSTISHSRDLGTIQGAIERLHGLFQLEMDEQDYRLLEPGCVVFAGMDEDENETFAPFEGEMGWYLNGNQHTGCEYSCKDYPALASEWVKRGITSYAYDNYSLRIVASSGNIVY
jgi:hypothetical protein